MNKNVFLLLTSIFLIGCVAAMASDNPIPIRKKGQVGNHSGILIPDVEPTVYYDNDSREITIVGTGFASYYDVEITALSTFDVPISTRIDGTYDTIDISSLPSDDYVITINTPLNIRYEGLFTVN